MRTVPTDPARSRRNYTCYTPACIATAYILYQYGIALFVGRWQQPWATTAPFPGGWISISFFTFFCCCMAKKVQMQVWPHFDQTGAHDFGFMAIRIENPTPWKQGCMKIGNPIFIHPAGRFDIFHPRSQGICIMHHPRATVHGVP